VRSSDSFRVHQRAAAKACGQLRLLRLERGVASRAVLTYSDGYGWERCESEGSSLLGGMIRRKTRRLRSLPATCSPQGKASQMRSLHGRAARSLGPNAQRATSFVWRDAASCWQTQGVSERQDTSSAEDHARSHRRWHPHRHLWLHEQTTASQCSRRVASTTRHLCGRAPRGDQRLACAPPHGRLCARRVRSGRGLRHPEETASASIPVRRRLSGPLPHRRKRPSRLRTGSESPDRQEDIETASQAGNRARS